MTIIITITNNNNSNSNQQQQQQPTQTKTKTDTNKKDSNHKTKPTARGKTGSRWDVDYAAVRMRIANNASNGGAVCGLCFSFFFFAVLELQLQITCYANRPSTVHNQPACNSNCRHQHLAIFIFRIMVKSVYQTTLAIIATPILRCD